MSDLAAIKAAARKAAFQRRAEAHVGGQGGLAAARLLEQLEPHAGKVISGYMAMRSEIDPRPAMEALSATSRICVPVIKGKGQPLTFALWTPETTMVDGPFGASIPAAPDYVEPEVLIVPLVAFDRRGNRLGYGGGFYDRTLAMLRAIRPTRAIGFSWAAQEAQNLPIEATDQPLDMIVTENEVLRF